MTIEQQALQHKRNLAALNSQTWQNMSRFNFDPQDSTHLPLSALLEESNKRKYLNQLDDSFEPISIVTPPKKRTKTEVSMYDSLSTDYSLPSEYPLLDSLRLFDAANNSNYNLQGMSSSSYVNNCLQYPHDTNDLFSARRKLHTVPLSASRPSFFNPNPVSTALTPSEQKMLDEIEPLGLDPSVATQISDDTDNDQCPDLCSSSRSLLGNGEGFIIQTSDSFKENNYAKAEIVAPDSNILNLMPNSSSIHMDASPDIELSSSSTSSLSATQQRESPGRFKPFHEEKWNFHYQELVSFKREHGHCLVPHTYPPKPHLARWVKRQRRQYKLRAEGNANSTMTEDRINILNEVGFVWDSHEVVWSERFAQLAAYKHKFGHCRVPSYCKECPQLASWVKCQRRQYKLFWEEGKSSSMNLERIALLNGIGFIWEVHPGRKRKENEQHFQHIANILMDS